MDIVFKALAHGDAEAEVCIQAYLVLFWKTELNYPRELWIKNEYKQNWYIHIGMKLHIKISCENLN